MLMISVVLAMIGGVQAAYGPGGGAIVWAESEAGREAPSTILIVAVLRAAATTAAVAAGGCGGVFVPFLAIGDLAARAFAPGLGVSADLAGAAGAASGIAGGYRLPWTAVAMVVSIGGPVAAVLTSLGSVVVASIVGAVTVLALDRLRDTARRRRGLPAAPH
jgi:H+/Cl- antiporter ClcA